MQETILISKFKATCLRLLENVKKTGKSIIVTRKGEPIALVTPPPPPPKSDPWLGCMKDRMKISIQFTRKFWMPAFQPSGIAV